MLMILSLILLSACGDEEIVTSRDTSVLLPLAVGNTWIYEQTRFDSLGTVLGVSMDTIRIDRDTIINGETWYHRALGIHYANRDDGVWLNIQATSTIVYKYPMQVGEFTTNNVNDTTWLIDSKSPVSLLIGQFSAYQYQNKFKGFPFSTYMVPGIGWVIWENVQSVNNLTPYLSSRYVLVKYIFN